jgi:predicted TIM-barrel fold metal-dependent hydrolase
MIVDSHAHIIAHDHARYPLMPAGQDEDTWYRTVPVTAEELAASMKSAGVDRTVVVQAIRAYGNDNRYLVDSCTSRPDVFVGVGVVDVESDDAAVDTMRELILRKGLAGVRLNLAISEDLIDPGAYPLMECADEVGVPVLLRVTPKLLPTLPRLLRRFSRVPMVLDHCGFVSFRDGPTWDAAAALFEIGAHENLYLKVSSINLYDAMAAVDPAVLVRDLAARFGGDRLVWGSDYPHTHDRSYAQLVAFAQESASLLSEDDAARFLGETAARLWAFRAASPSARQPAQG